MARAPSRKRLSQAFKTLWDQPEGRLALGFLIGQSGVLSPHSEVIEGQAVAITDPVALGIAEGQRRAGLEIIAQLNMRPEETPQLARDVQSVYYGEGITELLQ